MGDDRTIRSGLNMIREEAQKGKSVYAIGKELGISKRHSNPLSCIHHSSPSVFYEASHIKRTR